MDDQRLKYQKERMNKSFDKPNLLKIFNKNKFKIFLFLFILSLLLFPAFYGHIAGTFINKLITAFTNQITF
jgi:hypothetical protein